MASFKDTQQTTTSRPLPSSMNNSLTSTGNARQSHSRSGSSQLSLGVNNANHRVARRKSVTAQLANAAAVAAILGEAGDKAMPLPISVRSRRNTMSKNGASRPALSGSLPSPPASLPAHKFLTMTNVPGLPDSAIDDDSGELSADDAESAFQEAKIRRASDGQPLSKDGGKTELRCQECGKGYKHSSCLTKHLWEHTPEWGLTSKLLISKHQQVQLLEAASVLVTMNTNSTEASSPEPSRDTHSDRESDSPSAFDGSSDQQDGRSSADTTPPPQPEAYQSSYRSSKRYSNGSGIARSYQSNPQAFGSMPTGSEWGQSRRPSYSQRRISGETDHELAAAVELLSCSFGSNNGGTRTVHLPADAPPVPPLPTRYLDQATLTGRNFIHSFPSRAPESNTRGERRVAGEDVRMENSGESGMEDEDDDKISRTRSDEDDEGVFGRMEE